VHFVAWNIGARRTAAAHASLLVSMIPLAMPPLAFVLLRERPTRREWLGTAVAVAGMLLLTASDFRLRPEYFVGDAMCFVAMLLFALYLALGRRYRCVPSLWLYVVPVYTAAGMLCLAAAAAFTRPFRAYAPWDLLMLAALAVIPTVVGHSALNAAMKHFRAQTVSVLNMGQFIFAGVLAYACFGEVPAPVFYPASGLLIAGCWLVITGGRRAVAAPPPEPAAAAGSA
jgi:drug/metabolite transporter (DMT)-like permease